MLILSGGQTGVDQAALRAARQFSISTGGVAPRGWLTEDGPAPWLADFELTQDPSPHYRDRTLANVARAHAVLWLGNPSSPGGRLTLSLAAQKPSLVVVRPTSDRQTVPPQSVIRWLCAALCQNANAEILVAGNRESSSSGIGEWAEVYLLEVFDGVTGV